MEREGYWLWLTGQSRIGNLKLSELLGEWGDAEAIYWEEEKNLKRMLPKWSKVKEEDLNLLIQSKREMEIYRKRLEILRKKGIRLIPCGDSAYPEKLKQIAGAPVLLYQKGIWQTEKLNEEITLAVVGTRKMTRYGKEIAEKIGKRCADYQIPVISGMAAGIDGAVQQSVLRHGGYSVGVLGSGLGYEFPAENRPLYAEMNQKGALISEEWVEVPPFGTLFPKRNRIISGMADVVIVVEAAKKSGSLITADFALEQGRDICVVPGRIGDKESEGCNHLLSLGADLIENLDDFFAEITGKRKWIVQKKEQAEKEEKTAPVLSKEERKVYEEIGYEPIFVERIYEQTGIELSELQLLLLQLEWKELIEQISTGYYVLR